MVNILIQTDEKAHTDRIMALYRKKLCGEFGLLTSKIRVCVCVSGRDETRSRTLKCFLNSETNTQFIITIFMFIFLK